MSLIAMAVHDTEENKKTDYTEKTIESLVKTVNFDNHRLFIIDNNSCESTKRLYEKLAEWWALNKYPFSNLNILLNEENIGTAKAINKAWVMRRPGENCVKMDNDIVIHQRGWVEIMEEAISRDASIGQIGLKRKDCWEHPEHENKEHRSILFNVKHIPGERWIIVEQSKHIIGSCVMHSASLLDRVGYLYQPGLYGYDDVLMSWRANLAGFKCVFLPQFEIDHIDPGDTAYQGWKERHSGQYSRSISELVDKYISGEQSLYYEA